MMTSEILKKQISISYPNANFKFEKELIGIDIEDCGRLYVNKNLEIHISLMSVIHKDELLVKLFFSPRIQSEYMRIYISNNRFQAYRKTYGNKPLGNLELAMEYFKVFKKMHDSLFEFKSYK